MNLVLFDQSHQTYHLPRADDRARHIVRVLRAVVGDTIRVGVLGGERGCATVTESSEDGITLHVEWDDDQSEVLPVSVLVGHPRPPVLQRLLRDLAALRVAEIHVFVGALSEASYLESSLWSKTDQVIREGLSQGMHTSPPVLHRWRSLPAALDGVGQGGRASPPAVQVYGAVAPPSRDLPGLLMEIKDAHGARGAVVAIGPERGFTSDEVSALTDNGFTGVDLGRSTLRTETAAIVLVGAVCAALS